MRLIKQAERWSNVVADDAFIEKSVRWAQRAMLLHGHPHVRMYQYLLPVVVLLGAYTYDTYIRVYARIPKLMLIYTRTFPVLFNFLLRFSIFFLFGGRGRVLVCGISNGGMCAIEICKATLAVDFYVRCTYVRRYGLVRARIRTLLVSLRRCAIVSHACGWRPRPRQLRRWRRIGRPHSSCTA